MRTLFRITEDLNALADMLTEAGGEISDDEQGSALESWFKDLGYDLRCRALRLLDKIEGGGE